MIEANTRVPQTFQRRAREIGNHANNLRGALGEGADFLRGLDEMERQCEDFQSGLRRG